MHRNTHAHTHTPTYDVNDGHNDYVDGDDDDDVDGFIGVGWAPGGLHNDV